MTNQKASFSPPLTPLGALANAWRLQARFHAEVVALMTRRAEAVLDVPKTFAACQTPEDALRAQVLYWQRAQRDYQMSFARSLAVVLPLPPLAKPVAAPAPDQAIPAVRSRDYLAIEPEVASRSAANASASQAVSSLPPVPAARVRRSA